MSSLMTTQPSAAFSPSQLSLIKRTVAKDTLDAEFDLFISIAKHRGLNPLTKQICCLVFNKDDPARRQCAIFATIDGLRSIAFRSGRYRPDEEETEFYYADELKGPHNPLGLERAVVRLFTLSPSGEWRKVTGVAYWEEFAPIKEEGADGFDWIDTGEVWPDSGKPKRRKVPRGEVVRTLDKSGNWGRMPRVMLQKTAEAQALRRAFPEDLSGLYGEGELDRMQVDAMTASEMVEAAAVEDRMGRIGAGVHLIMQFDPHEPLERIPLGQVHDRLEAEVNRIGSTAKLAWFESVNTQPMREFWGHAKADALHIKSLIEARREALAKEEEAAA